MWATNGVAVYTPDGAEWYLYPEITGDGAGGAIIAWSDLRSGDDDTYAQRVDGNGNVLWTADGVAISSAEDDQYPRKIVSDGGAIIAWLDWRNGNDDIYAQRVDADGNVLWTTDGVAICTAEGRQD
ncbi:MAG: hypothetical protein JSW39_04850 [Desulfobacterales bacterium]|nr:MAG: hypothetical protein JSW39_04850 [Desulfobacterales bacterium]